MKPGASGRLAPGKCGSCRRNQHFVSNVGRETKALKLFQKTTTPCSCQETKHGCVQNMFFKSFFIMDTQHCRCFLFFINVLGAPSPLSDQYWQVTKVAFVLAHVAKMGLNAVSYCKVINVLCSLHYRRLVVSMRANCRWPSIPFTSFNHSKFSCVSVSQGHGA